MYTIHIMLSHKRYRNHPAVTEFVKGIIETAISDAVSGSDALATTEAAPVAPAVVESAVVVDVAPTEVQPQPAAKPIQEVPVISTSGCRGLFRLPSCTHGVHHG